MKRFRGTKGEWKVVIPDHIGCTNVQFGDDIFNGFIEVWHHQSSKEEAQANAHLICAAPDLLKVLIGMTLSMKAHPDYHFGKNQEFIDYVESAEQVINKALGLK